jgi:hypothetical protein
MSPARVAERAVPAIRIAMSVMAAVAVSALPAGAIAQPPAAQQPARAVAPFDITGQWVSVITEDWRHRMMTPPRGDVDSVPVNAAGRAAAEAWDPDRDEAEGNQCKSYGAAAIMRVPGRLRISWENDQTLSIETDSGRQTRRLHFGGTAPAATGPTLQGVTRAEWRLFGGGGPAGAQRPRTGSIRAVTTDLSAGYLRKNGVPYSADALLTEHFDLLVQPDGTEWLVVQTIVEDPAYLTQPFITSSNFRRESDRRGWDPQACTVR